MSSTGQLAPISAGQATHSKGLPARDHINLIPDELLQIILSSIDPQKTYLVSKRFLANTISAFKSDQLQRIRETAKFLAEHINLVELSPLKTWVPGTLPREVAFRKMWNNAQKAIFEHIKQDPSVYATFKQVMPTFEEVIGAKDKAIFDFRMSLGAETALGQIDSQEEYFLCDRKSYTLLGVFRGHGGVKLAKYVNVCFNSVFEDMKSIYPENIFAAFEKTLENIHKSISSYDIAASGCTSVITYVDRKKNLIYTATLGNHEAHLYRKINGELKSIPLSCVRDWRSPKDAMRAAHLHGKTELAFTLPFESSANLLQSEQFKKLNISRGIGFINEVDNQKRPFVNPKPKITVQRIEQGDFLLVASAGLRKLLTESEIVKIISGSSASFAAELARIAHSRQSEEECEDVTTVGFQLGVLPDIKSSLTSKQTFNLRAFPPNPHTGPLYYPLRLATTLKSVRKSLKEGSAAIASQIYFIGSGKLENIKEEYTKFPFKPIDWENLFNQALLAQQLTNANAITCENDRVVAFNNILLQNRKFSYFGDVVKITKPLLEKPWNFWSWFAIRKLIKEQMGSVSSNFWREWGDDAKYHMALAFLRVGCFDQALSLAISIGNDLQDYALKAVFRALCDKRDLDLLLSFLEIIFNQKAKESALFYAFAYIWHLSDDRKQAVSSKIEVCYKLAKLIKTSDKRFAAFATLAPELKGGQIGSQNIFSDMDLNDHEIEYLTDPAQRVRANIIKSEDAAIPSSIKFTTTPY